MNSGKLHSKNSNEEICRCAICYKTILPMYVLKIYHSRSPLPLFQSNHLQTCFISCETMNKGATVHSLF